jgi:hypothetical protein
MQIKGLRELERDYRRAASLTASAEARGVRRVSTTIVAKQSRAITQRLNLKVTPVKKAIVTLKKPTAENLRLVHEVRGEGISLISYGGRGSWKKATVVVLRGSGRKTVRGGFLTKAPEGGAQIWKRTGAAKRRMQKGRYKGKLREPIAKQWGPSILSQYVRDDVQKVGRDTFLERVPVEVGREVDNVLKRAGLI